MSRVLDHPVRALVRDGVIDQRQLRACRLTGDDLHAALRQRGVPSLTCARLVLFESHGCLTVVCRSDDEGELTTAAAELPDGE